MVNSLEPDMTSEPVSQAQPNEVERAIDLDHEHTLQLTPLSCQSLE